MEQTPNYKLLKPAPNDYVDIGTFNQNTDLIDSELKKKYGPDNKPTAADVGAAPAEADASYPSCYYRMVNGVKEWINPPMQLGIEYRTTERWNGKAVYRKAIAITFPNTGRAHANAYIPASATILSLLLHGEFRADASTTTNNDIQYTGTNFFNKEGTLIAVCFPWTQGAYWYADIVTLYDLSHFVNGWAEFRYVKE